jgi:hypothetical protein
MRNNYSFILSPLTEDGWAGIQRGFTPAGIRGREIVRVRGDFSGFTLTLVLSRQGRGKAH